MKKNILLLTTILFWGVTLLVAQTQLELSTERLGIQFNQPSFLEASQNAKMIYVEEITQENPLPSMDQTYGSKPSVGAQYLNSMLGMVSSILTFKNGECVVFVYVPPGKGGSTYGRVINDSTLLCTLNNISFGRIKSNFKYGIQNKDATELEALELNSMLTHYSHEDAQNIFNANVLVSYPLNLRGNIYKNKFSRGKAVVVGKDRHEIYLYFMMTDESVLNFPEFLKDFERVFWFKK